LLSFTFSPFVRMTEKTCIGVALVSVVVARLRARITKTPAGPIRYSDATQREDTRTQTTKNEQNSSNDFATQNTHRSEDRNGALGSSSRPTANIKVGNNDERFHNPKQCTDQCSNGNRFVVGEEIECRYNGGPIFFPGKITAVQPNDTYAVKYRDGDSEAHATRFRIRRKGEQQMKKLSIRDQVDVRFRGGEELYRGHIAAVCDNGDNIAYDIKYSDGDEEKQVPRELIFAQCKSKPKVQLLSQNQGQEPAQGSGLSHVEDQSKGRKKETKVHDSKRVTSHSYPRIRPSVGKARKSASEGKLERRIQLDASTVMLMQQVNAQAQVQVQAVQSTGSSPEGILTTSAKTKEANQSAPAKNNRKEMKRGFLENSANGCSKKHSGESAAAGKQKQGHPCSDNSGQQNKSSRADLVRQSVKNREQIREMREQLEVLQQQVHAQRMGRSRNSHCTTVCHSIAHHSRCF
jgi:hypothetical protein